MAAELGAGGLAAELILLLLAPRLLAAARGAPLVQAVAADACAGGRERGDWRGPWWGLAAVLRSARRRSAARGAPRTQAPCHAGARGPARDSAARHRCGRCCSLRRPGRAADRGGHRRPARLRLARVELEGSTSARAELAVPGGGGAVARGGPLHSQRGRAGSTHPWLRPPADLLPVERGRGVAGAGTKRGTAALRRARCAPRARSVRCGAACSAPLRRVRPQQRAPGVLSCGLMRAGWARAGGRPGRAMCRSEVKAVKPSMTRPCCPPRWAWAERLRRTLAVGAGLRRRVREQRPRARLAPR